MTKKLIIIFVKNPNLGQVKTRLASSVGDDIALKTYQILIQHTAKITSQFEGDKMVFYSEKILENDVWENSKFVKKVQSKGDLGTRMNHAFNHAFDIGYEHVVIIGSDLFSLDCKHLKKAFHALKHNDVVVGPSLDGGYYLLGLKTKMPYLFSNKSWSQSTVLEQTLEDLKSYSTHLLEPLNDIDTIEDLQQEPELLNILNLDGKTY